MQQQLLEGTVNITPDTMHTILSQLLTYISSPTLDDATLNNIIKALFYGLWNFDKMINQHNLSTAISQLPLSIPKQQRKNGLRFYEALYSHLSEKWAFIDKHRINKFMQLIRYLMRESFNFCKLMKIKKSKPDEMLNNTIFKSLDSSNFFSLLKGSGLLYHVTDLYFEIVAEYCIQQNEEFDFHKLQIFENLLRNHQVEHFRHHVIAQVYGKYKAFLVDSFKDQQDELEQELQKVIEYFLQLAKQQQKELNRKNIYLLVAYFKSPQMDFVLFQQEKRQKAEKEKQKIKKKLSKGKLKQIKEQKAKRKEKNKKLNKNKKIISKRKFQINGGKGYKKFIEDF